MAGKQEKLTLHFVTIHPQFIKAYFAFGVFKSAQEKKLASFLLHDLRKFSVDDRGSIDDRPYGGGESMVFRPEPLASAVKAIVEREQQKPYVILTSPSGKLFKHDDSIRLSKISKPLCFIAGRFGGVDQRFVDHYVDEELSIGDYVISGGELACLVITDSILRQIEGVLGNSQSPQHDSFASGLSGQLEYPLYTRPPEFEGLKVPEVLLSGNHKDIKRWQQTHSRLQTALKRPELNEVNDKEL